jgi:cyclohexadienyl dehydratase
MSTPFFTSIIVVVAGIFAAPLPTAYAQARFTDSRQDVERVIDLMIERLALMRSVGRWKQHHGLPIQDVRREREVLDATVCDAERLGIEAASARRLFELQIELARNIQQQVVDAKTPETEPLRDLNGDLRPALDRIGKELLVAIYLAMPELERVAMRDDTTALQRLAETGIGAPAARLLLDALAELRRVPTPTLERVRASGVLRVGMTGDYAPFSLERDGELSGADVAAATKLAAALGVTPRFVRTSWPTLMDDYRAGRFDIAMSGISITVDRAAEALFSRGYHRGGKTPIVRCGREADFDTLEEIDRATTQIVVNPGGTNERFVRERVQHARILMHPDNRTIFEEVAAGRADLMITDDIEVERRFVRIRACVAQHRKRLRKATRLSCCRVMSPGGTTSTRGWPRSWRTAESRGASRPP